MQTVQYDVGKKDSNLVAKLPETEKGYKFTYFYSPPACPATCTMCHPLFFFIFYFSLQNTAIATCSCLSSTMFVYSEVTFTPALIWRDFVRILVLRVWTLSLESVWKCVKCVVMCRVSHVSTTDINNIRNSCRVKQPWLSFCDVFLFGVKEVNVCYLCSLTPSSVWKLNQTETHGPNQQQHKVLPQTEQTQRLRHHTAACISSKKHLGALVKTVILTRAENKLSLHSRFLLIQ